MQKNSLISVFSLYFRILNPDFIIHIHVTHIADSNTASDDVTN